MGQLDWEVDRMIHVIMIVIYRLIVLFVLGCTVRHALDKENDGYSQLTAVLLVIPLLLRVLMIK
jgi:hypothetical protein